MELQTAREELFRHHCVAVQTGEPFRKETDEFEDLDAAARALCAVMALSENDQIAVYEYLRSLFEDPYGDE